MGAGFLNFSQSRNAVPVHTLGSEEKAQLKQYWECQLVGTVMQFFGSFLEHNIKEVAN